MQIGNILLGTSKDPKQRNSFQVGRQDPRDIAIMARGRVCRFPSTLSCLFSLSAFTHFLSRLQISTT